MGTNASLSNLIIMATVSSSLINLGYQSTYLMPNVIVSEISQQTDIADWKMTAFNLSPQYTILDDEAQKMAIILQFSKKIIEYSVDLDDDIVEMVNENFWELL